MAEQDDVLADLGDTTGALACIAWAVASAYKSVMHDYNPETGHRQGWVGYTAHELLCDRLDRVSSCGKYAVDSAELAGEGLDVLAAGLLPGEFAKMPRIAPGVIRRSDLNGSPGWQCGEWRWLLASFPFGEVERIPWSQKSNTKQRVARQLEPDLPDQLSFELDAIDTGALFALESNEAENDAVTTLVLAHGIERDLEVLDSWLGRPRLKAEKGKAWYWKLKITEADNPPSGRSTISPPVPPRTPAEPTHVADAPVRLRGIPQEGGSNESSG